MEPAPPRKLLDQVCNAIALSITPTAQRKFVTTFALCKICWDTKIVKTTMIYPHVLNRGGLGVRSPLDG